MNEQANLSYHCCVLTDDVLQLILDVSNLSSETEFSVIVLNTVQYALDSDKRESSVPAPC